MDLQMICEMIIAVVAGVLTCIPLVVKLAKTIKEACREKNWNEVVSIVTDLMSDAENMFATGAERKEWVLQMIPKAAAHVNYEIDMDVISHMIDVLCDMSKKVNVPAVPEGGENAET